MLTLTFIAYSIIVSALGAPTTRHTPVYPINYCEFFQPSPPLSSSTPQTRIGGCMGTQYGCCGFPIDEQSQLFPGSCMQQNCTACEHAVSCFEGSSQSALNATETVLEYVQSMCRGLSGPSAFQCVEMTAFGIEAIGYIEQGMNTSNVCHRMGYCRSAVAASMLRATTRTG